MTPEMLTKLRGAMEFVSPPAAAKSFLAVIDAYEAARNDRHTLEAELFGLLSQALDSPDDVTVIEMAKMLVQERDIDHNRSKEATAIACQMADAAEMLWITMANVSGGSWRLQSEDWQQVAGRARDLYFGALTRYNAGIRPAPEPAAPPVPPIEAVTGPERPGEHFQALSEVYGLPPGQPIRPVRFPTLTGDLLECLREADRRMWPLSDVIRGVIDQIDMELVRALLKFPTWPTDPLHAVAVVVEECGELSKAVLEHTYQPEKSSLADVRDEAIQTAAMAVRFLLSLHAYEFEPSAQHHQGPKP